VIYAFSDLMKINLPIGPSPDEENSVVSKMEAVLSELTAACGDQVPNLIPMPVVFDTYQGEAEGLPGLTATTSNPVNCLLTQGGVIRYSKTGCALWEQYIQAQLPGAVPITVWDFHCANGEVHCATAAIRSFPATPPWNKRKPNWE
jgi:hypothetical protein